MKVWAKRQSRDRHYTNTVHSFWFAHRFDEILLVRIILRSSYWTGTNFRLFFSFCKFHSLGISFQNEIKDKMSKRAKKTSVPVSDYEPSEISDAGYSMSSTQSVHVIQVLVIEYSLIQGISWLITIKGYWRFAVSWNQCCRYPKNKSSWREYNHWAQNADQEKTLRNKGNIRC